MILILTDDTDVHADRVAHLLTVRGRPYWRFDPASFPAGSSLSIAFGAGGLHARRLVTDEVEIDLDEVEAVWFRRPGRPRPVPELAGTPLGDFIAEESATAVADLWDTLDVRCVPGPRPLVLRAQHKARQLQLAARLGFELPPTIITTDPSEFLEFFSAHDGRIITKRIGFSQLPPTADGDPVGRYTEPVRHRDLIHLDGVRLCPIIVQAYVPKQQELRVTVVGDTVLAAAINSQEANHTRHDWRRYDNARTVIRPYPLPRPVTRACRALVNALGLCYGAIDLILTPDGRHVFLELNPSGQYLWVEEASGLPISEAIVDLLTADGQDPASAALPHTSRSTR
jgi:glutathione synthase/RimK-type ligase-like ATP-grasp enzyme